MLWYLFMTPIFYETLKDHPDVWQAAPNIFPWPGPIAKLDQYSMDKISQADIRNALAANEELPND